MTRASFQQTSFLGGKWSKAVQGRTDRPDYRTAMNVCKNGLPIEAGAWTRRPGTLHCGATRAGGAGRLITLNFQDTTPYNMEFTAGKLRMWTRTRLATNNDAVTITDISTANPAVVTTSAAFGVTGQAVRIDGLGALCPTLQGRIFTITKTDTNKFTMVSEVAGTVINGSTLGWVTPSTLPTVSTMLELTTQYSGNLWSTLRSVQADKQSVFLHQSVAPYVLTIPNMPGDTTDATFSLDPAVFEDGPYLDPFTNGVLVTPSGISGVINLTLSFQAYDATRAYAKGDFVTNSSVNYKSLIDNNLNNTPASNPTLWVTVSAGAAIGPNGFLATDIGRMVRLYSEPPVWASATTYAAGNVVAFGGAYWTALISMTGAVLSTGETNPNQPGLKVSTWAVNPQAPVWSWGKIIGFANLVSGTLSGSANIGDMTGSGGLAAAFDGTLSKALSACATKHSASSSLNAYVGKDYTGASAQKVGSVTVFPSTDQGYVNPSNQNVNILTFNLYAKQTLPANATDGTLLATKSFTSDVPTAVNLISSDQATSWNYVWVNILAAVPTVSMDIAVSQVQVFNPTGTGAGTTVSFQILGSNLLYTTAVRTWRLGLYSDTTGWPTAGTYHEGRLWLTGAQRNRIDASRPNSIFDMAPTEPDGTVDDGNGISYVFNADDVNAIYWMKSIQQGILCGTQGGEWLVQATSNNNVLTPTSIQAHKATRNRCANIEPRSGPLTLLVVQAHKHKLLEYFADVFSGKLASPNLSLTAPDLCTRGLEELAYQNDLSPVVWVRCTDGSLIGASYKRDSLNSSQGPTFIGWHEHTLGSGRTVESLSSSQSVDGILETVMMVTNSTSTNVRHVEMITNLFEEGSASSAAWFCDNAVAPTVTQSVVSGGVVGMQCIGLWHLNGSTITVFAGGLDCGDYLVSNGQVNVPYGSANGLFTAAFAASFASGIPVVAGFTYTSDGQIVRVSTPQESGARNGPALGKSRRVDTAIFMLVDTQGLSYGTDFSRLSTAQLTTSGRTKLAPTELFSGTFRDVNKGDETFDEMLCWRVTRPYPAIIAAAGGFIDTKDV